MKTKVNFSKAITAGIFASAVSVILNVIIFYVFQSAGIIVDTILIQPETPLTVVPVIIASILPLIIGSIVFFLIDKYTSNGIKIFNIVSILFLLVSLIPPFVGIEGVTTGYAIALDLMHLASGFAILFFINRTAKAV